MKATSKTLFNFLKNLNGQLAIPIYQRDYNWSEKQITRFWEDLNQIDLDFEKSEHFLGTIVSKSQEDINDIELIKIALIDGQQRITCATLLFAAICAFCKNNEIKEFKWENKIYNTALVNLIGEDDKKYRLVLQKADNDTLKMIIDDLPEELNQNSLIISRKIAKTYNFFYKKLTQDNYLDIFNKALRFKIFDGQAEEHDDAQIIFDSLNTPGAPLKNFEQIRNYTLMDFDYETQEALYFKYWEKMMDYFKNRTAKFDEFTSAFKRYRVCKLNQGGNEYDYIKKVVRNGTSKEDILDEMYVFFEKFKTLQECKTGIEDVDMTLNFILRICGAEIYPILVKIYDSYLNGHCDEKEFLSCITLLDNYICRHKILENSIGAMLRKSFNDITLIERENCLKSLEKLSENNRITDNQFKNALHEFKPYSKPAFCKIFLERIENSFHEKGQIPLTKYSIEHIMPQKLNATWKSQLGANYQKIHYKYCENLGNLTLTAYNSEMSNETFEEKLSMKNGFKDDRLHLNKSVAKYNHWNEDTIMKRLDYLTDVCLEIWS